MRKSLKKVFAGVLAVAMVITAIPAQPVWAASKKTAVVSTQKELKQALKDGNIKKIKIKTKDATTFKLGKGKFTGKKLVVDAPNAKVENKGAEVKQIKLKDAGKWVEKAEGNHFVVTDTDSKIVVKKLASVENISYKGEGAKAELKMQGTVKTVAVEKAVDMVVTGKAENVTIAVAEGAKGTTIVASIKVNISAETNIKVELAAGAEGSSVTTTDKAVEVEVKNDTKAEVTVTTPEGEQKVEAGKEANTDNSSTGNTGSDSVGGTYPGGSSYETPAFVVEKVDIACGDKIITDWKTFEVTPNEECVRINAVVKVSYGTVTDAAIKWSVENLVGDKITLEQTTGKEIFVLVGEDAKVGDKAKVKVTVGNKTAEFTIVVVEGMVKPETPAFVVEKVDITFMDKIVTGSDNFTVTAKEECVRIKAAVKLSNGALTGGDIKWSVENLVGNNIVLEEALGEEIFVSFDSAKVGEKAKVKVTVGDKTAEFTIVVVEGMAEPETPVYELESYGSDFTITAAEGLTAEDITVNAVNWEIRLNKAVATGAAVAVTGTTVFVDGEAIATLSDKVAITGKDANGNVVSETANLTWNVIETSVEGIYKVVGTLGMPAGWSNTYGKGIALSVVITSLVSDNLYDVKYIGFREKDFILTPAESATVAVTATPGAVTINSVGILDGSLLSIEEGTLKYNGEVIGILPTEVKVGGTQLKDSEKWDYVKLALEWQNALRYDSANGTYQAVANLITNENWLNTKGQGAIMTVMLKSDAVEVKELKIWDASDAAIFEETCLYEGAYIPEAVIASGSAIAATGEVKVEVDADNRTVINYKLDGTLPKMAVGGNFGLGHYILYSLERANVTGAWSVEGTDNSLSPVSAGAIYAFSGNKVVACQNLANLKENAIVIYLDVDYSKTFNAGDVKYIIDCSGIVLAE